MSATLGVIRISVKLWAVAASLVAACGPLGGRAGAVEWLVGRSFQERLNQAVDVNWSATPLRAALEGLAREQRVAVFLDRRIDPDRRVDVTLHDQPLDAALNAIAGRQGAASVRFGPLVYLGPARVCGQLSTLAARGRREAARVGGPAANRLLAERVLRWDELAEPRAILAQLGSAAGLEIRGLELVPHDLWAAADLPAMAWVDCLTLVAVQFDLTFMLEAEGRALRLVAISESAVTATETPSAPAVAARGGRTRRPPPAQAEAKRYTLRQAKGQLRELLPKLAAMLQVELRVDEEALRRAGITLDQVVSVSATDATAEELLKKLLAPAGCTLRREGRTWVVGPK